MALSAYNKIHSADTLYVNHRMMANAAPLLNSSTHEEFCNLNLFNYILTRKRQSLRVKRKIHCPGSVNVCPLDRKSDKYKKKTWLHGSADNYGWFVWYDASLQVENIWDTTKGHTGIRKCIITSTPCHKCRVLTPFGRA